MTELRNKVSNVSTGTLCELFGKSRQAYYQQDKSNYKEAVKADIIMKFVQDQRKLMPRLGARKLHHLLKSQFPEDLHLGRDAFFDLLRDNQLLIRRRRNTVRTTFSSHWLHKYPNLIREFTPGKSHQLWVSDITYVETKDGFVFLFLITDAYSRKIIGWSVGETLEAKHAVMALNMALKQLPGDAVNLIHHSDRGIQYCSALYVKILKKYHIQISMTENGDPLENAIAERINGVLKSEWIYDLNLVNKQMARKELGRIINIYNIYRPHTSVNMMTPEMAHKQVGEINRLWKNYYKKKPEIAHEIK